MEKRNKSESSSDDQPSKIKLIEDSEGGKKKRNDDYQKTHLTEAYLQFEHRLENRYKLCEDPDNKSYTEIEALLGMIPGNTTEKKLDARKWLFRLSILGIPTIVGLVYVIVYAKSIKFQVPSNAFALVTDRSGKIPQTRIYGPGYHFLGMYYEFQRIATLKSGDKVEQRIISSSLGDLMILTVDQGEVALFEYSGQYKILGPGLHMIRDPMNFIRMIRLDKFYIKVGPEKWLTIPEQYDGIALDNGKTVILKGGRQHHLPHKNFKFAKLVPKILLTDRIVTDVVNYVDTLTKAKGILPKRTDDSRDPTYYLQTKTKDGSVIYLDAMLFWQIVNTKDAVHKAMNVVEIKENQEGAYEEDEVAHIERASRNIDNLRMTVLRFAKSHLAEIVGCTSLTEDMSIGSSVAKKSDKGKEKETRATGSNQMSFVIQTFLSHQTENLLEKLNGDLNPYGVLVSKITINDAIPTTEVQKQLDRQVKARIDQNTELVEAETKKRVAVEIVEADRLRQLGTATNSRDAALIEKEKTIILAQGEAESDLIRAEGKRKAAEALSSVPLSRELALIEAYGNSASKVTGTSGDKVYFGLPLNEIAAGVQQFGQLMNSFKQNVPPQ